MPIDSIDKMFGTKEDNDPKKWGAKAKVRKAAKKGVHKHHKVHGKH